MIYDMLVILAAIEVDPTTKLSTFLHTEHRSIIGEKTWPLNQPTFYIPQSLMYHEGWYKDEEESDLMVELIQMGLNHQSLQHILNLSKSTKVTNDITKIFTSLNAHKGPKFLLIEGTQGMGKTILLKEIVYRWANDELLITCKLVFLIPDPLHDPQVHKVKTLSGFLQYFCDKSGFPRKVIESVFASNDNVSGTNVAFFFDSFEEFPTDLQEDSFVHKVLKREVLPNCVLVVSSRPHASACLRPHATVRVHLLGFTEMQQKKEFIEQALEDQQQNREVTQYLERESTINNLCFVPLNMTILLHMYLFNYALFSSNLTELYSKFLCLIICRHLAKHNHSFENTTYDLRNLPAPYDKIITNLCKLSSENLKTKMKTVFTCDDIKETCPDIFTTPGAINGFGLLQAVQCDYIAGGRTIKFTFSHRIIQETLASHHIYIPNTQLKCLRFFKTWFKAGNKEICRDIVNANIFDGRTINLRGISLTPSDVECLTLILIQSPHQEWEEVDMHGCNIEDRGIVILHQGLMNHNIIIKRLSLSYNNLTKSSSSKIHDIVIHCAVQVLAIRYNPAISKDTNFFSSLLSDPNSKLEELYMSNTNCTPSSTVTNMFSALEENKKLKTLQIINNNITDDDCNAIVEALQKNTSLVELNISGNQINAKSAKRIIQALADNNTLEYLALPWYKPKHQKDFTKLAKRVSKKRDCRLDLFCHQPFR